MRINREQLENILKKLSIDSDKWSEPIHKAWVKFNLCNSNEAKENANESAMFLAQCGHESCDFKKLEENLNYSPETLLKLFLKKTMTIEYARSITEQGTQAVGNFIYGGRVDLGNYAVNDGYKYRGRGIIQLTGKKNYKFYGEKLGLDLVNNPDMAKEPYVACNIACCYWRIKGISAYAREGNVIAVTRKINGGLNGFDDRERRFKRALSIIREVLFCDE